MTKQDEFIKRAGFNYGWENLESWARRMADRADRAVEEIGELEQQLAAKQAEVDALMLEYCPSEMSQEQLANWAAHQRPSEWKTNDELRDLLRPFAALLQKHNGDGPDEQPMLQINDAKITRGDLRRALAATTPKEQLG